MLTTMRLPGVGASLRMTWMTPGVPLVFNAIWKPSESMSR
jgi:hypothetical protein